LTAEGKVILDGILSAFFFEKVRQSYRTKKKTRAKLVFFSNYNLNFEKRAADLQAR